MESKRDNSLDAACGLMIIYMIYGHICLWSGVTQVEIFPRLLFFFMPWFFFKSGMFFKPRSYKSELSGGARRLLVPYMVFSIIGQMVFYAKWLIDGNTSWKDYILVPLRSLLHEGAVVGNSPLWFLLTLFLVRVIYNAIYSLDRRVAVGATILFGMIAYVLRMIEFHGYFYVANVCCGLFFYGCGYWMRNIVHRKSMIWVCGVLYVAYAIMYPSYFDFRSNDVATAVYPFCMMACIGGVVFVNWLFASVKFLQKPFAIVGKNSMAYYAAHWIVLGVSSMLLQNVFELKGYTLFGGFALVNLVLLPCMDLLFNKYCRWAIGK